MAREYCRLLTSIWGTREFVARSAGAQRLYFLLLSQPELSMCGVLTPAPSRWASFAPDTTDRGVKAALAELQEHGYIVHDRITEELWIRSFVRHDSKLGTPNVAVGVTKAFCAVRSPTIRLGILQEIRKTFPKGLSDAFANDIRKRFADEFREAERKALADNS
jgi:hypothetical protein